MVLPIPGLADAPYLSNETIFGLDKRPDHLIVVGSGHLGAELAQAHRRLGAKVTILEMFNFLGKGDPALTTVIRRHDPRCRNRTQYYRISSNDYKSAIIPTELNRQHGS
jgi:pyruvate/2-oxoglutarate dehydrogenase complex dihydrolipoamide dehydrogenase (E3) component